MERDLRGTDLYDEIEERYRRALEPGFGRVTSVSDPQPSPDGRTVAFTGDRLDRLDGEPEPRICLADAATGEHRQVTSGPKRDWLPRWSPDGRRLAFASDRARRGRAQVYLLGAGAIGEAEALPELPGSVEWVAWAPGGDRLLAGVAGLDADRAAASGSGKLEVEDELPSWVPDVESSEDADSWRRLWAVNVDDRVARPASREGLNVWEAAWCGAERVVAIASRSPGEEAWYSAPLVLIDVATGHETELLRSDVQLGLPCASPDGRTLAVVEALCSDRLIVAGDLLLLDARGGEARRVDAHGVDVTSVSWRGTGSLLYMGLRGMETVAGEVDASSGEAAEVWSSSEASGEWYPEGRPVGARAFVTTLHSGGRAPAVVVVEDGAVRTIADTEHAGSRFLMGLCSRRERVTWTAPDGLEIEGLLTLPEGEPPFPLILWVHGGPVWAYQDAFPRVLISILVERGYAVLQPNPRGSSGRGRKFAELVVGDMGGADARDLLAGIDDLVRRGVADGRRVGVTGGSYGGFMSCRLPTLDDRFAAAAAISPVTDWYSQHFNSNIGHWDTDFLRDRPGSPGGEYHARSPVLFADRVTTPTLLTAGLHDACTPPGQAWEFHRALRARGIATDIAIYPEEGHGVRKLPAAIDLATRVVGWFERFMPPGPARRA